MARSPLYQKILDEAAAQRKGAALSRKPRKGAATGIAGGLSNAPVVPGPLELREASLHELAAHIVRDWRVGGRAAWYGAAPYLDAMRELHCVDLKGATYGADSASSVVRYFLSNARTWRGPVARVVKAELNRRLK